MNTIKPSESILKQYLHFLLLGYIKKYLMIHMLGKIIFLCLVLETFYGLVHIIMGHVEMSNYGLVGRVLHERGAARHHDNRLASLH